MIPSRTARLLLGAFASGLLLGSTPAAQARIVVAGPSWLGGQGVDVCYPANDACGGNAPTTSPYGFQCVDLAQRLYHKLGWYGASRFAGITSASQIYDRAAALGFVAHANGSGYIPVPGDMVIESPTVANQAGHVAVVDSVAGNTVAALEENGAPGGRHTYSLSGSTISPGYGPIRGVVHAPGNPSTLSGGGLRGDGSLIHTPDGSVFRIAGRAPLYVSGCGALSGGCAGVVPVPNLDGYASRPANGTILSVQDGRVWVVAGGAPLAVSSCDAIGGCQGAIQIDPYAVDHLDHLNPTPTGGTLLRDAAGSVWVVAGGAPLAVAGCDAVRTCDGYVSIDRHAIDTLDHLAASPADGTLLVVASADVWVVAGGAPLRVSGCDAIDGCDGAVLVDRWAVDHSDHLALAPADDTLLRDAHSGQVWVVAGGAPLAVASCAAVGGCGGYVDIDPSAVTALDHLRAVPRDGTVLRDGSSGHVWTVAGGAPVDVNSCAAIISCAPYVTFDSYAARVHDHLGAVPADGTFLNARSGDRYRMAGGAALPVSDCTVLGGCASSVLVDPGGAAGLIGSTPIDGTCLIGVPSNTAWAIRNGQRTRVGASCAGGAVLVNDAALSGFPVPR